jgi:hypothetical protein
MLYAGTETGIYISFDDGEHWQTLKLNLPNTPVHDIQIQNREKDLVIATHGRSFWVLDDITSLYQLADAAKASSFLYKPRPAYRKPGGSYFSPTMQEGENAPNGVLFRYYFKQKPDTEVTMRFFDMKGDTIITYSSVKDKKGEPVKIQKEFYQDTLVKRPGLLPLQKGMNAFVWDMRYPDVKDIESGNKALLAGGLSGQLAVPGIYTARLYIKDSLVASQPFTIVKDPRVSTTQEEFQKQFDLAAQVVKKQTETNEAINRIRKITKDVNDDAGGIKDSAVARQFKTVSQPLLDSLKKVEEELTQPKAVTDYDLFNFPDKLNDKLAGLKDAITNVDASPTQQEYDAFKDLSARADAQIARMKNILETKLAELNKFIEEQKLFLIKSGEGVKIP